MACCAHVELSRSEIEELCEKLASDFLRICRQSLSYGVGASIKSEKFKFVCILRADIKYKENCIYFPRNK